MNPLSLGLNQGEPTLEPSDSFVWIAVCFTLLLHYVLHVHTMGTSYQQNAELLRIARGL